MLFLNMISYDPHVTCEREQYKYNSFRFSNLIITGANMVKMLLKLLILLVLSK